MLRHEQKAKTNSFNFTFPILELASADVLFEFAFKTSYFVPCSTLAPESVPID